MYSVFIQFPLLLRMGNFCLFFFFYVFSWLNNALIFPSYTFLSIITKQFPLLGFRLHLPYNFLVVLRLSFLLRWYSVRIDVISPECLQCMCGSNLEIYQADFSQKIQFRQQYSCKEYSSRSVNISYHSHYIVFTWLRFIHLYKNTNTKNTREYTLWSSDKKVSTNMEIISYFHYYTLQYH